jgi:cytochrome o ubiquinol oxidase operon protein cyoD
MPRLRNYIIGFVSSVALTLVAFWLVAQHLASDHGSPSHEVLFPALILLAVIQFFVQLVFFLHVGRRKEGWNTVALFFALFVVVVIVGGSLWIMSNLAQNHGTPYIGGEVTPQSEND